MELFEIGLFVLIFLALLGWLFCLGAISKLAGIVKDHLEWHKKNKQ